MRGQTTFQFNVFTFVKIVIFLSVLAFLLYAIITNQSVASQAISMNTASAEIVTLRWEIFL